MLKIFLSKQFYYLQSSGFPVREHRHIAPQISVAQTGDVLSSGHLEGTGLFFGSEVGHAIVSGQTLHTFLINPVYQKARSLKKESSTFTPDKKLRARLGSLNFVAKEECVLQDALDQFLLQLNPEASTPEPLDERIAEVVAYIDELEQKRIAAGELAEQIALSESRFLHLFKEEMKMTVRKYLLWERTMDGARLVVEGKSITEAAHATGFTDSAHFARVFKQMFGVTLSLAFVKEPKATLVVGKL